LDSDLIDLDNCRFVVWGFKNDYRTHSHIHEAFYRTLKLSGKSVLWLDSKDDLNIDFSNTFFITEHEAAKDGMPLRDDCFYTIHGLNDDLVLKDKMSSIFKKPYEDIKNRLGWNVYHDFSHSHGLGGTVLKRGGELICPVSLADAVELDEDVMFYPKERHIDFRWATDLLPYEIEAYKPSKVFRDDSSVINYVGTLWFVNEKEIAAFKKACDENNIRFELTGAGTHGVISVEDNIRLVRESYMAPAISGSHHLTEGYAPCRIFKNISYGQFGITNSARVNKIFGGKLIFNPNPYQLFYEARERLKSVSLSELHSLMDEVAQKHTYLNRLSAILTAAKNLL
jgi:hypothetical protein